MFNFISVIFSALSKKIIRIALVAIIILASVVCYYNAEELARSPFDTNMNFFRPYAAAVNQDGYMAVIDSIGSRIVFISPEKKVLSTESYSTFSSSSPNLVEDICLSRENVYLVDYTMEKDGVTPKGQRILVYDLNGKFQKVLADSSQLADKYSSCEIHTVSTTGGRVYATLCYNNIGTLVIADITDGTPEVVHTFTTNGTECYFSLYHPDTDVTTAVGYNGHILIWRNELQTDELDLGSTNVQIERADVTPEGNIFTLDSNSDAIFVSHGYKKGFGNKNVFIRTDAKVFSVFENLLVYTRVNSSEIHVKNILDGHEEVYKNIPYSTNIILKGFVAWGMLLLGIASAVILSMQILFYLFSMLFEKPHKADTAEVKADHVTPMTVTQLYAHDFLVLFLIFGIMAFATGRHFYSAQLKAKESLFKDIAYGMSRASADTFGSAVSEIRSAADYDTKAYNRIDHFTSSIGMTKVRDGESFNILCRVYRFGKNNIMTVKDDFKFSRIGAIWNLKDQSSLGLVEIFSRVKAGRIETYNRTSLNGTSFFEVYAPVYNSHGKVIGALVTFMNRTMVQTTIIHELMEKFLEIFTFLIGLIMLLVELKYMWEISKIQKERHHNGIWNTTVVEIDRTMNIFAGIPSSVYIVFCTLITAEIINKTGLENPILLAFPVTVNSVVFNIARSGFWYLIMTCPKKGMQIGAAGEIAGIFLLLAASVLDSYAFILISSTTVGAAAGLLFASMRPMYLLSTPPKPKYKYMLYTNTEAAIASAIGISMASVVMKAAGAAGLALFVTAVCSGMILIIHYFMGDDLAVNTDINHNDKIAIVARQKKKIAFFLRPHIVILLLFTIAPVSYLSGVTSYVMPLFNKYAGHSEVYMGAITAITGLIGVFATPALLRVARQRCQQNRTSLAFTFRTMLFLGVVFVLFGLITTLRSLILVVIGAIVINPVIRGIVGDMIDREGIAEGFNYDETAFGSYTVRTVCSYTQSIVLSLTLVAGFSAFGYIWAVVCAICAALMLLLMKKQA